MLQMVQRENAHNENPNTLFLTYSVPIFTNLAYELHHYSFRDFSLQTINKCEARDDSMKSQGAMTVCMQYG